MLSIEISVGDKAQVLPLSARLVLGASHGLVEGAIELEPRGNFAIAHARASGVEVGTHKVAAGTRRILRPGDSIRIGAAAVSLREKLDDSPQTKLLAKAMLRGVPHTGRPGMPSLLWLNGPDLGKRVMLMEEATFLGRGDGCVARLNDAAASRMHAKLVRSATGFQLVDLMSSNGVLVDGERVLDARALIGGEVLQIGATLIAFERPAESRREPANPPPPSAKVVVAPVAAPIVVATKPVEPVSPNLVAEPELPVAARKVKRLASFELALIGVAIFAIGTGSAVIAWALR